MALGARGASEEHDREHALAEAFARSMPSGYRVLFDPRTTRRHALIAERRGDAIAHVETWRTLPDGCTAVCIVADDRPGLLSSIAAAFVFHRLDVVTALVFSRLTPRGDHEAVDLFWVRRAGAADPSPIDDSVATSIGEVLAALLTGRLALEEIAPSVGPLASCQDARVVVRFEEVEGDELAALIVEAPDRPGMLLALATELFRHGAQIVRSLVRTANGRAFNRFELADLHGGPLDAQRRADITRAMTAVIALSTARASE